MTQTGTCPIWRTGAETGNYEGRDGIHVNSLRAGGRYFISGTAAVTIGDKDDAFKAKLTTWLIDQRRLGVKCPEISTYTFEEVKSHPALSVIERGERLLQHIAGQVPSIGDVFKVPVSGVDETLLAVTESLKMSEVTYLLDMLEEGRLIEKGRHQALNSPKEYAIAPGGYAHLSEAATQPNSKQAFVAMWFDPSMDEIYENAISPAIVDAGYSPMRIDKKDHNNKIDDEIVAEIKRSAFVVSDFTYGDKGMRGGVYYEAGLAHGLGLPVIFTCREDLFGDIHFDTRQYNHLSWKVDQLDAFRTALANRISATIGDGPLKKQNHQGE